MSIFLILAIVTIVYLVFSEKKENVSYVENQGGMITKYNILLSHLCPTNPKIEKVSGDTILISNQYRSRIKTTYTIFHQYRSVKISLNLFDPLSGTLMHKWEFPETTNQDIMASVIMNDISSAYGLPMETSNKGFASKNPEIANGLAPLMNVIKSKAVKDSYDLITSFERLHKACFIVVGHTKGKEVVFTYRDQKFQFLRSYASERVIFQHDCGVLFHKGGEINPKGILLSKSENSIAFTYVDDNKPFSYLKNVRGIKDV